MSIFEKFMTHHRGTYKVSSLKQTILTVQVYLLSKYYFTTAIKFTTNIPIRFSITFSTPGGSWATCISPHTLYLKHKIPAVEVNLVFIIGFGHWLST